MKYVVQAMKVSDNLVQAKTNVRVQKTAFSAVYQA